MSRGRIAVALDVARRATGRERTRRELLARWPESSMAPDVEVRGPDRLELGPRCRVDSRVLLHCGDAEWAADEAGIRLGADVYVGPHCVLFGGGGIDVGAGALISPGVVVTSHQHTFCDPVEPIRHQPLEFGRVTIGAGAWIGANASVLPGVTIGDRAVIGAGAVVTRDVAPATVVVGVPADTRH